MIAKVGLGSSFETSEANPNACCEFKRSLCKLCTVEFHESVAKAPRPAVSRFLTRQTDCGTTKIFEGTNVPWKLLQNIKGLYLIICFSFHARSVEGLFTTLNTPNRFIEIKLSLCNERTDRVLRLQGEECRDSITVHLLTS